MEKDLRFLYTNNGKPVHRVSFCAFLDVLGFSARTWESYENFTGDQLLQEFHETFSELTEGLKSQAGNDSPLYYKSFSDNVLLAVPRYSPDMESESGQILVAASEYQFKMALKGFFIRGGIAKGPLFIDDNSVYGGALIEAYELESQKAVNPIIILCDQTAALVDKHIEYYASESGPQRRMILVNSDGNYFINYLDECIVETDGGLELDTVALAKHRSQIQNALVQYSDKQKVVAKFEWLGAYHNYFCDSVSGYPGYSAELRVPSLANAVAFSRLRKKR